MLGNGWKERWVVVFASFPIKIRLMEYYGLYMHIRLMESYGLYVHSFACIFPWCLLFNIKFNKIKLSKILCFYKLCENK